MKNLLVASLLFISASVFASRLITLKEHSNPVLNQATKELRAMKLITHSATRKVIELKGKGSTIQELRLKAVAQALHSACSFFDEGIKIAVRAKSDKGTLRAMYDLIDSSNISEGDEDFNAVFKSISAINKESNVEIYSGSASGNNTAGTVFGFYDYTNEELSVFASTNCGSDD